MILFGTALSLFCLSSVVFLFSLQMTGAAGQNKQHFITKNTAKLDRETEELHHDRVSLEVGKVIQQGRQSKGLTQKDLATVSAHFQMRVSPFPVPLWAAAVGWCCGLEVWGIQHLWFLMSLQLQLSGKSFEVCLGSP